MRPAPHGGPGRMACYMARLHLLQASLPYGLGWLGIGVACLTI